MSSAIKSLKGSALLVAESLSKKMVGLISTIILARVLMPEDFGLVAIALIFGGFLNVLSNTGTMEYLLRVDKINDSAMNTAWSLSIVTKSMLALVFVGIAPLASHYYDKPELIYIFFAYAGMMVMDSLNNPGLAILRRNHDYSAIVKVAFLAKVVSVITAVIIAVVFRTYWALVIGTFTSKLITVSMSYMIHPFRPRWSFESISDQWQYSSWVIPKSVFGYFRTQLDTFIVSFNFGSESLGSYHVMKYLSFIPSAYIILPATQPLLVELAQVKYSAPHLLKQFNVGLIVTLLIAVPISLLMYSFSEGIVVLFLGDSWVVFSNIFGTLGFLIPAAAMYHQAARIMSVYGHTRNLFIYEIISFLGIYGLLIFTADFTDLLAFTTFRVGFELAFSLCFLVYVVLRYIGRLGLMPLVRNLILVLVSTIVPLELASYFLINIDNTFFDLSIKVLTYSIFYCLTLFIMYFIFGKYFEEWLYLKSYVDAAINKIFKS
ncbi:MAG: oligosaccharide flippase family protein [Saccharospirillum sp.]